jgi:outer membrane protein with beta-barrel domain
MLSTLLAAASTAAPAQAQWVIMPYLGVNFAGDVELSKGGPGVSVGYFAGPLGFEFDLQRYQHFFKDSRVAPLDPTAPPNCMATQMNLNGQPCTDIDTDAVSFMGNIVVPIRSQAASKWRAYGSAGVGVIRGWTNEPDRHQNDIGFNTGGGVMYSLGRGVGVRGDLRYFRALVDENESGNVYAEDYGFWRVAVGVTIGFPR